MLWGVFRTRFLAWIETETVGLVCLVYLSNPGMASSHLKHTAYSSALTDCTYKYAFLPANEASVCLLSQTGEKREIYHFHYTTWPDFGVPDSPASFLNFLFKVRESGALGRDHGPAVVHCSAGIGRSGTFSLVDTCVVLVSSPFLLYHYVCILIKENKKFVFCYNDLSLHLDIESQHWPN